MAVPLLMWCREGETEALLWLAISPNLGQNRQCMTPDPLKWRIVLVRPRNPLNIGAAARAMANFGFRDLVVVQPYKLAWQETRSAPGAEDIVHSAKAVASVPEALDTITLAVGTTSGERLRAAREILSLENLSAWLRGREKQERAALLFGSEKTGLTNEHFSYCQALVRIPTSERCPSMNLGQAVAVCCFELARVKRSQTKVLRPNNSTPLDSARGDPEPDEGSPGSPAPAGSPPSPLGRGAGGERSWSGLSGQRSPLASIQSLEHLLERAAVVLDEVGYLKPKSRAATLIKLRSMVMTRGLSNFDAKILGGVLAQIQWKLDNPSIRRGGARDPVQKI
jgi:TrmH family RNA methyltransferase